MLDFVPLPELLEYRLLLIVPIRGDHFQDRFADHLLGCITENALRAFVLARDDSVERLADDAVVGARNDCREKCFLGDRMLDIRYIAQRGGE
jgi:hypothetical protein